MLRFLFTFLLFLFVVTGAVSANSTRVKVIALFTDKAMLQVGDRKKIVEVGETFEGVLLKSASGRGAVVVVDGETLELGLISRNVAGGYKKPVRDRATVYPDTEGMYFIDGKINGRSTRFLIDTGATDIAISGQQALQLGIEFRDSGKVDIAETASGRVPVYSIRLDSVTVGGISLRSVDAIVIPGNHPSDVLLGNSFLRRTQMIRAGSVLEIRKRY